jgi:hypothetical protein
MESGEAARYLEERIANAEKELSFAEISVDRQVAAWMAPFATLFVLLFQFSHLQQAVRIRSTLEERLSSFPWVALFTSRTARVLTVVTGVGIPVVANALLVARVTSTVPDRSLCEPGADTGRTDKHFFGRLLSGRASLRAPDGSPSAFHERAGTSSVHRSDLHTAANSTERRSVPGWRSIRRGRKCRRTDECRS